MSRVGYLDPFPDIVSVLFQGNKFAEKQGMINHHAVSDHADFILVQDSRGYQMENILLIFYHNRMPGVRSALIAHHNIAIPGEIIDHLRFSFIAPLCAYDNLAAHTVPENDL